MNHRINFDTFFNSAPPTAILRANVPDFTVIDINKAFLDTSGTKPSDILGRGIFEAFPENPKDPNSKNNIEALRNSLTETVLNKNKTELPLQRYDIPIRGTKEFDTRYWQAINSPILGKDGEVEFIVHVTTDITKAIMLAKKERISFEVADRKRRELHTLFMEAPGAICILSGPTFIFDLVNPTFQDIFPGRELLGKPVLEALPEMRQHPLIEVLKTVYDKQETFEGKEVLTRLARHTEGPVEDIYWNFIYKPRCDFNGKVDGILVFAHEVTDQVVSEKRAQEIERQLKLALERK
ncbi:PAS domain-containing protein [Desertivirga arenae]|uniref:PAS domain-containing protein n=1 Tax=Desertivirga arenae TaxID=2810309 RepID=UPI001A96CD72|nr:PAS domain-containing protein [Pedobacter sp. SYSU D00823]